MHYQGSCHCGAIRYSFHSDPIEKGVRCNCSICARKGAMMSITPIPENDITFEPNEGVLGLYQFGAKTVKHYFCRHCGIYTFHETASKPGHYRFNLGCIEGIDPLALDYELFDGQHLL